MQPILPGGSFPLPIAPSAPALGNGSFGPWQSGMANSGTSTRMNQWAFMAGILLGQYSGGGYGIVGSGLQVTATTGLSFTVSPGIALCDGEIEFISTSPATGPQVMLLPSYALTISTGTSYVWIVQAPVASGALASASIAINGTVASPPTNAKILLANVTTVAGSITDVDYSGRCYMQGVPTRMTGDIGAPSDSPPATWFGLTITLFGTYLWNGTSHLLLPPGNQNAVYNFTADTNVTLTQPQFAASMLVLTDTGSHLTTTREVIYPAAATGLIGVFNNTAQSLEITVTGGTGFTLATGKKATFYVDSIDAHQVTAAF